MIITKKKFKRFVCNDKYNRTVISNPRIFINYANKITFAVDVSNICDTFF